ncbi:MAG: ABC transporter substrate-binding protein, partial [Nitrospira sp.]|nr:ABC transporter substrate-binding protein [Nitrospira sp.]
MKRFMNYPSISLLILLIAGLMGLAACGQVAAVPAPAAEEKAQPVEAAEPVEEAAEATEEAASETAAEKETPADNPDVAKTVQESKSSQELNLGVTVVTDEPDVSTLRTNLGGTYRDIATSDAVSFHPYLTSDGASGGYQGLVYTGGLLRLHEDTLEYIPNMAESYTISDDGLTFTFKLREDMKWSDGQPITAHDFKWTYDQATKPENGYP